jgi:hypothetical protein
MQDVTENFFSKIGTSKLHITGTALLGEPSAIKSKPSTVAHIARQCAHLLSRVKCLLTRS